MDQIKFFHYTHKCWQCDQNIKITRMEVEQSSRIVENKFLSSGHLFSCQYHSDNWDQKRDELVDFKSGTICHRVAHLLFLWSSKKTRLDQYLTDSKPRLTYSNPLYRQVLEKSIITSSCFPFRYTCALCRQHIRMLSLFFEIGHTSECLGRHLNAQAAISNLDCGFFYTHRLAACPYDSNCNQMRLDFYCLKWQGQVFIEVYNGDVIHGFETGMKYPCSWNSYCYLKIGTCQVKKKPLFPYTKYCLCCQRGVIQLSQNQVRGHRDQCITQADQIIRPQVIS